MVSKIYDPKRDGLYVAIDGKCEEFTIIHTHGEKKKIVRRNDGASFFVPRKVDKDVLRKIEIICDKKSIEIQEYKPTKYKLSFATMFNALNVVDLLEDDKILFENEDFFKELRELTYGDRIYLLNSLEMLNFFPLNWEFEIVYRGYEKFNEDVFFEYLCNNFDRFISLPEFEKFVNLVLNRENNNKKTRVLNLMFKYPVKRSFLLLEPYIYKNSQLRERVLEFIKNNQEGEFGETFLNVLEGKIIREEVNDFVSEGLYLVFNNFEDNIKSKFLKILLTKRAYADFLIRVIPYVDIDQEIAKIAFENINVLDKEVLKRLYVYIKPHLKYNLDFYIKILELIPDLKDRVLDEISYDFNDPRLDIYYFNEAKKRPIPLFVLNYVKKLDDKRKGEFLKVLFAEPVIQKEIIDLMEEYDRDKLKDTCDKILIDEKHVLQKYVIEKVRKTKILSLDRLLEIYEKSNEKIDIIKAILDMDERGKEFVAKAIDKELYMNEELIELFFEKGKDRDVVKIWDKIDKSNKKNLIAALKGLEKRRKPILCDEILNFILNEKDKELKFAALWSYVYNCQDLYLKNFDKIKSSGDNDFYIEMIVGLKDLIEINPTLQNDVIEKVRILKNSEENKEVLETLNSVIGVN